MYRHNPRSSTRRVNAPSRSRAHYATTIQRAWRRKNQYRRNYKKKATASYVKSSRSVNRPNTIRFKGKSLVEHQDKPLSRTAYKVMKQLSNAGIIEKRLISHSALEYNQPQAIATDNDKLRSMSGAYINYSNTPIDTVSSGAAKGIPFGYEGSAFNIANGVSPDKYVFYKNFQAEITITTTATNFSGVPDPTQASQLGFINNLNFRVLLIKKRPNIANTNQSGTPLIDPNFSNSLFLGYDGDPYGLTQKYGQANTGPQNVSGPIDVMLGKVNNKNWQVLQDKQFCLSIPVANTAGAEGKYPHMKKLVFRHPIMEKVQVSTFNAGTRPMDWNDQYVLVVLAGLPNSSAAHDAISTPTIPVPQSAKLWRITSRGWTSYLDA